MIVGDTILTVINFLLNPAWHLVVFYVILLLIVAYRIFKSWFPG